MKKDHIYNGILILFAILVFVGIGYIIKKDINKIEKQIIKCRKICYPAQVAEQFSKKHCMCLPIIEDKEQVDQQNETK